MNYVIIGNSAAAIGAVEGIRSTDKKGNITIISAEKYHTYSRPLISYLMEGKTDIKRMKFRPQSFYKDNCCICMFNKKVLSVDALNNRVILDSGESVTYDKLLCATGSSPFIPDFNGLEKVQKKFTFMSLDDALNLKKCITEKSRILIIGAGLIGMKCAEGIKDLCASVTVADLSDRVLSSILDEKSSGIIKAFAEKNGIKFKLRTSVEKFENKSALMTGGERIDFDILVLAVGVKPNTELLKNAGAGVGKGIILDSSCKTTLPDIYAAGDCTESFDISSGKERILALLPNAYRQGECAGICMAGGKKSFNGAAPMNAIGLFGKHILTAGTYTGKAYTVEYGDSYKKLFYDDGVLKGFILLGDVKNAGIYTRMITDRTPLESVDFGLVCKNPTLMAFKRSNGGVANDY